jgi:hypothetical protein
LPLWVLAALLTAGVPVAQAVEIQPPEEHLTLELHGKAGFVVYFELKPQQHVAVVSSQKGSNRIELRRGRWLGAAYATHSSFGALTGEVHLRVGHVGILQGHFVADEPPRRGSRSHFCRGRSPLNESGHFVGRIAFRGDGGYLRLHAHRARAYRTRSFRLRCAQGHAHHEHNLVPGLFGYIAPPLDISNQNSTFLFAHVKTRRRVVDFQALHYLREQSATFRAAALEWLPEGVAATRWVEVSRVASSTFQVEEAERHPRTASVSPPLPFHGEATYLRENRQLRGNLRVSFLGENLRLASRDVEAELCRSTPEEPDWLCR